MLANCKNALNRVLKPFGVEIARYGQTPTLGHLCDILVRSKIEFKTVFDVGVYKGTSELYSAFPDATFFLIDPAVESNLYMNRISRKIRAEIINVALSDRKGTATLSMSAEGGVGGATILEQAARTVRAYEVKTARLDEVVPTFERPAMCKIDVQGGEVSVLKGMKGIFDYVDLYVVEISTIGGCGQSSLEEVFAIMQEAEYTVFDVVQTHRRRTDGVLGHVDLAFVQKDSPLRAAKAWHKPRWRRSTLSAPV